MDAYFDPQSKPPHAVDAVLSNEDIRTILDEFRLKLPEAAGATLSNEEIVRITNDTVEQCRFPSEKNLDWLSDPSILHARLLLTFVYGAKERKFGGTYRGTHPLGVAHWVADKLASDPEKQILAAFIAIHHDTLEDISQDPKIRKAAMSLILSGWQGDRAQRTFIQGNILSLTDAPGLETEIRFQRQIDMAKGMTWIGALIRFGDKYHNTGNDEALVKDGTISNQLEIVVRAKLARDKVPIVMALAESVTDTDKQTYIQKTESLEARAKLASEEMTKSNPLMVTKLQRYVANAYREWSRFTALLTL